MITLEQAKTATEFWLIDEDDNAGPAVTAKATGIRTWNDATGSFEVEVLIEPPPRSKFHISNLNARDWCVPTLWPVEHVIYGGRYAGQPDVRAGDCAKCGQQPGECVCSA